MLQNLLLKEGKETNEENDDDINAELVMQATNNSFLRTMSDAKQQSVQELLNTINFFLLKTIIPEHQDLSERKWCIVQLDQKIFQSKGFFSQFATCGGADATDLIQYPQTLKLYCLVLNMENRQLHFQSLEDPQKHLFINFDTIPVEFVQIDDHHPFKDSLISLKTHELNLDIYITPKTLPFPYSITVKQQQQQLQTLSSKKLLEKVLKESIETSRGNQLSLSSVLKYQSQFSKRRFVTEEQFTKYCQTGDVLLFRDNHTMAKVQRVLSNSEVDHVGIVYKSQRYGICLFQSNSSSGVAMAIWSQLIRYRWFEKIQRISWRKLQVHNKPQDFDEKVTQFIKANLHKKFNLSLPKLLKFKGNKPHDEKSTYFCSQLVATLYKYLDLLDPQVSATQYWPKDFSDKGSIKMLNSSLDPERQIVFENQLLKQNYPFYKD